MPASANSGSSNSSFRVALAQIAPIWLRKTATLDKVHKHIISAAERGAKLVVFGETLVPGYPFWLAYTGGAAFENQIQKELFAHYASEAVCIEQGDLKQLCETAKAKQVAVYLGIVERPLDRGGHSLYCSLVYINEKGEIASVHRKLQPTYEERLAWSPGDGHGLTTHKVGPFQVGGLNCWENWMPLSRTALYAQGENLHVAVWPGAIRNTEHITRFIAQESRSYVLSVCGLLHRDQIDPSLPHAELIRASMPESPADGGSCISDPDGNWILEPQSEEGIYTTDLEFDAVLLARQNFDPAGHYSRPDITQLYLNKERQSILRDKP